MNWHVRHSTKLLDRDSYHKADILGQMQHPEFCEDLEALVDCETEDPLVRHEVSFWFRSLVNLFLIAIQAAEALGAIGSVRSLPLLQKHANSNVVELAETCVIAIDLINWKQQKSSELESGSGSSKGPYLSVDPAPPVEEKYSSKDALREAIEKFRNQLMNADLSLFERYRAMFTLRNMNTDESALALTEGFRDSSALFRHEVAYVLGQMQRLVTADALSKVLQDKQEHKMVRHEAAEALGAIGGERIESLLKNYELDEEDVVRESAVVALDTMDYWHQFDAQRE